MVTLLKGDGKSRPDPTCTASCDEDGSHGLASGGYIAGRRERSMYIKNILRKEVISPVRGNMKPAGRE
jgi:hypothetical protein